ncbi:MAG: hypothetical protein H6R15_2475 [Proteobacteria bacterium]|nr:hypothetical protein [Pseudomonadota bacterium]
MTLRQTILRLSLASALLGSLGACAVVPAYPAGYRAAPAYVESYPVYRPGYYGGYYQYDQRRYDDRGGRYYRNEQRYQEPRRIESPLPNPLQVHREIRRSLGLPRLPGMP